MVVSAPKATRVGAVYNASETRFPQAQYATASAFAGNWRNVPTRKLVELKGSFSEDLHNVPSEVSFPKLRSAEDLQTLEISHVST